VSQSSPHPPGDSTTHAHTHIHTHTRAQVMQRHVENPMLIGGRKFHLRVHALAVADMQVYVHTACLALPASEAYDPSQVRHFYAHHSLTPWRVAGIPRISFVVRNILSTYHLPPLSSPLYKRLDRAWPAWYPVLQISRSLSMLADRQHTATWWPP
jgi:predicted alpha/beta-hydrolase family hydrolase